MAQDLLRIGSGYSDEVSEPIRVAVAGWWHVHAGDYAAMALAHPHTELVAVWDDDPARGAAAAAGLGVPFEANLGTLLARDDVHALTVTTATSTHPELMRRAAEAGKHLFAEKLLAPTVAEAEQIISIADECGSRIVVSLPRLSHGYTRGILEVIASGRLGDLRYARVRLSHDGATAGWLPERFYEPGPAIGGALSDLGCHPVYLTQLFLGAHPDSVSATYAHVTGRAVEDHAVVTLGYPNGALGVVEAGFVSDDGFRVELHGSLGSCVLRQPGRGRELGADHPRRRDRIGRRGGAAGARRRPRPLRPVGGSHPPRQHRRGQPGSRSRVDPAGGGGEPLGRHRVGDLLSELDPCRTGLE